MALPERLETVKKVFGPDETHAWSASERKLYVATWKKKRQVTIPVKDATCRTLTICLPTLAHALPFSIDSTACTANAIWGELPISIQCVVENHCIAASHTKQPTIPARRIRIKEFVRRSQMSLALPSL